MLSALLWKAKARGVLPCSPAASEQDGPELPHSILGQERLESQNQVDLGTCRWGEPVAGVAFVEPAGLSEGLTAWLSHHRLLLPPPSNFFLPKKKVLVKSGG